MIDTVIGNYRVVRKLGEGGMGAVYEAVNAEFGRRAAIKVLLPELSKDPEMAARFQNEARAAGMIQHPGIVSVFDSGRTPDGAAYIVMDFLEGQSIRERLASSGGRLGRGGLRLLQQTASALAAAHDKGIVHRDLKPDNVMIVADPDVAGGERVKVLDFGIAKLAHGIEQGGGPALRTRTGALMGTPIYMAPEQCRGIAAVDAKADVYSLGVMLFQVLAGKPPFEAQSLYELMSKHINESPPPLESLDASVPADLVALTSAMLAKDPAARPTMREVMAAIEAHLSGTSASTAVGAAAVPTQVPARRPRRMGIWLGLGLLVFAGAAVGLYALRGQGRSAPQVAVRSARPVLDGAVAADLAKPRPVAPEKPLAPRPGMVLLPAVRFQMGSDDAAVDAAVELCKQPGSAKCSREIYQREQPAHEVTLSAFFIDADEVTCDDFAHFLASLPDLQVDAEGRKVALAGKVLADLHPAGGGVGVGHDGKGFEVRAGWARRPIAQVTWDGAVRYCAAQAKRLPSEAEWERAARGSEHRLFPWGATAPACDQVIHGRAPAGACQNDVHASAAVGAAPGDVTPEGVRDLGGNLSEWVADLFVAPYPECGACRDPHSGDGAGPRVIRGGNFAFPAEALRAAGRSRGAPEQVQMNVGFRCARSVD